MEARGLAVGPPSPARSGPRLIRRLTITCPVTGSAADTGFGVSDVPRVSGPQLLADCIECGEGHRWHIDDVVLVR
jgi:hypothetical protein